MRQKALSAAFAALAGQVCNYRHKAKEAQECGAIAVSQEWERMAKESQGYAEVIVSMIREAQQ